MTTPSLARDFFEQIRNAPDPVAFIRQLVNTNPPTYETDWLDFKEQPRKNGNQLADIDSGKWREIWVEALAGFANNQGGVIIWGIEARKHHETGVDAAVNERPITNPERVKSRLIELQRQATDPPLANVEIDVYVIPSEPGTGFVVCFVPEGPYKPYRSEDGRRSQYYFRSGDNFTILSRSMLQSLFYPRSQPYLWVHVLVKRETLPESRVAFCASVTVHNDGLASAKDVLIQINVETGNLDYLRFTSSKQWSSVVTEPNWASFHSNVSIHPGTLVQACHIKWEDSLTDGTEDPSTHELVRLNIMIAAENMEAVFLEAALHPEDYSNGINLVEVRPAT